MATRVDWSAWFGSQPPAECDRPVGFSSARRGPILALMAWIATGWSALGWSTDLRAQGSAATPPSVEAELRDALRITKLRLFSNLRNCIDAAEAVTDRAMTASRPAIAALAQSYRARAILHRDGLAAAQPALITALQSMPDDAPSVDRAALQLSVAQFHYCARQTARSAMALRNAHSLTAHDPELDARGALQLHLLLKKRGLGHEERKTLTSVRDALATTPAPPRVLLGQLRTRPARRRRGPPSRRRRDNRVHSPICSREQRPILADRTSDHGGRRGLRAPRLAQRS